MPMVSISVATKLKLDEISRIDKRTRGLSIDYMCDKRMEELNLPIENLCVIDKSEKKKDFNNTATDFCQQALIFDATYVSKITCSKLYEVYRYWCKGHGYYTLNNVHFGKAISKEFPNRKKTQFINPFGIRQLCFFGLDYKDSFVFPEYQPEIVNEPYNDPDDEYDEVEYEDVESDDANNISPD